MAQSSKIEWTDATWNPVTGCSKISPGCKYCYADRMANRLHAMGQPRYRNRFDITLQPDILIRPLSWREPRHIFVNSMSDLFHDNIPFDYIKQVFDIMGQAHWHTFQILTKRSERLAEIRQKLKWPDNVWMYVRSGSNLHSKVRNRASPELTLDKFSKSGTYQETHRKIFIEIFHGMIYSNTMEVSYEQDQTGNHPG